MFYNYRLRMRWFFFVAYMHSISIIINVNEIETIRLAINPTWNIISYDKKKKKPTKLPTHSSTYLSHCWLLQKHIGICRIYIFYTCNCLDTLSFIRKVEKWISVFLYFIPRGIIKLVTVAVLFWNRKKNK